MTTYVLYHNNCLDGFSAAYAAWKKFSENAQYIPVTYGQEPPDMEPNSNVYIVDFSYSLDKLIELKQKHNLVVTLDHHETAKDTLLNYERTTLELLRLKNRTALDYFYPKIEREVSASEILFDVPIDKDRVDEFKRTTIFDMDKSGAVLAWEYFHPNTRIPQLLLHVQDRDLWKFELDETKVLTAALWLENRTFVNWDTNAEEDENYNSSLRLRYLKDAGEYLIKAQDQTVERQAKSSYVKTLPKGESIWVCNTPTFPSETCQAIMTLRNVNIAACWHETEYGIKYSVRSKDDGNASELCKNYGGGGHRHAAGFELKPRKDIINTLVLDKTKHQSLIKLLNEWETEGDEQEQTEILNYSLENLP